MIADKAKFLKDFLPESVTELDLMQINLDITDLSFSDILRNLNKLYPPNTKARLKVEGGDMVLGVLCKSETLEPYNGVFLLVGKKDLAVDIVSSNYIVLYISEERIKTETSLEELMEDITTYLINNYADSMRTLPEFYKKYVYNERELYEENYQPEGY